MEVKLCMSNLLFDILEERYSPEEIWELIDDCDEEQKRDYFLEKDICPLCGGMISIHRWNEDRGEYWGSRCYEEMTELQCESCGETY